MRARLVRALRIPAAILLLVALTVAGTAIAQHGAEIYPCDGSTHCKSFGSGVSTGSGSSPAASKQDAHANAINGLRPFMPRCTDNCVIDGVTYSCAYFLSASFVGGSYSIPTLNYATGTWSSNFSWTAVTGCKTCFPCPN